MLSAEAVARITNATVRTAEIAIVRAIAALRELPIQAKIPRQRQRGRESEGGWTERRESDGAGKINARVLELINVYATT